MTIELLADVPQVIPSLARAFQEHWDPSGGDASAHRSTARLAECCERDRVPLGLVAMEGGAWLGAVALLAASVDSRPECAPWLAALYVAPGARRRGVAVDLVLAAEDAARRIGLTVLHAGTSTADSVFVRCGWTQVVQLTDRGEVIRLYRKSLCPEAAADVHP